MRHVLARGIAFAALAGLALAAPAQQAAPKPAEKPAAPKAAPKADAKAAAVGRDALKGKMKPGFYEVLAEVDMSNVPGVPADKKRQSSKSQECITQEEVDKGIDLDPACPVKSFASTANEVSFASVCRDGTTAETKLTFNAAGYTADMKSTQQHQGKPIVITQKMRARFLGACPAKPASPAPAPQGPPKK